LANYVPTKPKDESLQSVRSTGQHIRLVYKFKVAQRAMERAMVGVSLRKLKNPDIAHRISTLKWQWADHISRRTDNHWGKQVQE
jgi:hypothetical protein